MDLLTIISQSCILLFSAGAALMDLFTWKVSNWWILIWLGAGFFYDLCVPERMKITDSLLGLLVPLVLLGWLFVLRMMGAGDIKLFCVLGIWMGPDGILNCMLVSFLVAGAMGIVMLIRRKIAKERFVFLGRYLKGLLKSGVKTDYDAAGAEKARLPIAVPVLAAVILRAVGVYM